MKCGAPLCDRDARWRVHLVLGARENEVWVRIPVAVCSGHRLAIRRTVLGRILPPVLHALAHQGVMATGRVVRVRFTAIV